MSKPTVGMTATPSVLKQSDENALKKPSIASKFFEQSKFIRPCIPSSKKLKRGNAIPKSHVERIICSEDVSRKKKAKFDTINIFTSKTQSARDDIENDGDILESLITNFHKDCSKRSDNDNENSQRRKLSSKTKTLFNEESIKLINDFKQFLREKDQADRATVDTEFSNHSHSSMPFDDTSNSQFNRGHKYYDTNITGNNSYINNSQFNLSQRNSIAVGTINGNISTYYQPELIDIQTTSSQSYNIRREVRDLKTISPIQIPDPLSFVTTVMDSADDSDHPMTRYPTPPLTYSPNFNEN